MSHHDITFIPDPYAASISSDVAGFAGLLVLTQIPTRASSATTGFVYAWPCRSELVSRSFDLGRCTERERFAAAVLPIAAFVPRQRLQDLCTPENNDVRKRGDRLGDAMPNSGANVVTYKCERFIDNYRQCSTCCVLCI